MTSYHRVAAAFAVLALAFALALALALAAPAQAAQKAHAVAHLKNLDGKPVGSVDFAAVNRGVLITFDLHDLPPGAHAIHMHTSGNCDGKSGFTAADPS